MAYPRKSLWLRVIFPCGVCLTILAGLLLVPLVAGGIYLREGVALERRGLDVEGTITGLWTDDSWNRYRGSYAFTVDGREFTGIGSADKEVWDKSEVGGKVMIRYVPDNPAISGSQLRRDEVKAAGGRYSGALFGILVALGGVFILRDIYRSFDSDRKRYWLRDHGVTRKAIVLATGPDDGSFQASWRDEAGVYGQAGGIDKAICPEVGASILVFAHPVEPWPTVWEGEVGSRGV